MSAIDRSAAVKFALTIRRDALKMALGAGALGSHIAPALSCAEIFAVLYGHVLNVDPSRPDAPDRDRLLISKAHCVLALYSALSQRGFIPRDELDTFERPGTRLAGHPAADLSIGIEWSGGSLGQAMSVAVGMAIDAERRGRAHRVYVLLGDGELDEGSNWEAFMSAAHFGLGNITAIIDRNLLQYDGTTEQIMGLEDLGAKFRAFGWETREADGHDVEALADAIADPPRGRPLVVIARTIKGRGVSFMEGVREWHHSRLTKEQYDAAMAELDAAEAR